MLVGLLQQIYPHLPRNPLVKEEDLDTVNNLNRLIYQEAVSSAADKETIRILHSTVLSLPLPRLPHEKKVETEIMKTENSGKRIILMEH